MNNTLSDIIVAGHICLDLIPSIESQGRDSLDSLLAPGKLVNAGPLSISTGGAVSNTGLALHNLGFSVELMGKIGNDPFGRIVVELLESYGPGLAKGMIRDNSAPTSYTVVLSPPNVDRIFIHCPGANNTFRADDIDYTKVGKARLFHFGYPPLMETMYKNAGQELVDILRRIKKLNITTSLDMALPDPASPAGKVDWPKILTGLLPHVDVFLPSLDEILFMLGRAPVKDDVTVSNDFLREIAQTLLDMGVAIAVIKLGENGLYMLTGTDDKRLKAMGCIAPQDIRSWTGCEIHAPCFKVDVVGATGAGDCAIAGFLAGLLKGQSPRETLASAAAAGACNVEVADAVSGIPHWDELQTRIAEEWSRQE